MRDARMPLLGVVTAVLVVGGCASRAIGEDPTANRLCMDRREVDSLKALDDRHVFVRLRVTRRYLLTIDEKCQGLRAARTIAIEGTGARVCGDGSGLLLFERPALGRMRCRIQRIEVVPDEDAARELIKSRAAGE